MKTHLDCYPCFLRQALEAARMAEPTANEDGERQRLVLDRVLDMLRHTEDGLTPPEIGDRVHRIVRKVTGVHNPYRAIKMQNTRELAGHDPRPLLARLPTCFRRCARDRGQGASQL